MGLLVMDARELHRISVLSELLCGTQTTISAANIFGLTPRHTSRPLADLRHQWLGSLAQGARGRPPNHRRPGSIRAQALALIYTHYFL